MCSSPNLSSRVYIRQKKEKEYINTAAIFRYDIDTLCWFRYAHIGGHTCACRLRIWFVHSNHQKEKIYHKKERKRKRVDLKGDAILKTSQNYLEVSDDTGIIEFLVMHAFADKLN